MAKTVLPVDFQDDILNESMNGKRKYNLVPNGDGTYSLEDVSTYDQVGSSYGAGQINAANEAVNASADAGKIIDDIDTIGAVTEDGYIAGAKALKSVNDSLTFPNGTTFYADIQDGKPGFNTDPKRGADTFTPFSSGGAKLTTVLYKQSFAQTTWTAHPTTYTFDNDCTVEYDLYDSNGKTSSQHFGITINDELVAQCTGAQTLQGTLEVNAGDVLGVQGYTTNTSVRCTPTGTFTFY